MDLTQLSDIAISAARAAGELIQKYMNEEIPVEIKKTGSSEASQVLTAVDRASEIAIISRLLPSCEEFEIALLSEETPDDGARLVQDYFWCIDPMDGTLAFINGRAGFSVSIALVSSGGTPHIGVVYDPSTDILYHAIKGHGAYKNGTPWTIKHNNDYLTYVTDRQLIDTPQFTKIETFLDKLAKMQSLNGVKEISGAGAVMNAILVLENSPACMLKLPKKELGGGSVWDYAATACIYHELGLPATNYNGGILDLNRRDDTFMNHEGIFYASSTVMAR